MAIQWHEVYDDALGSSDIVAVGAVVATYLDRPPTRSEITAARRAAKSYAAGSNRELLRVAAPIRGRVCHVLVIARSDADTSDVDRLAAIATGSDGVRSRRGGRRSRNIPQRAESIVAQVTKISRGAYNVKTDELDGVHASQLADDLAAAINDLRELQLRLRARGRRQAASLRSTEAPIRHGQLASKPPSKLE